MTKMDPQVKDVWTTALESGEYEQGKRKLEIEGKNCCLGVLTREAIKAGIELNIEEAELFEGDTYVVFEGCANFPPDQVKDWSGLESFDPEVVHPKHGRKPLSELNDDFGVEFPEIAALIREQL